MAFIGTSVNRLQAGTVILFVLALGWPLAAARAEEPYLVSPVHNAQDLRLLPASAWHPADADQNEMLLKLSYLRGILDALQYLQVAPKSSAQALNQLQGQGLGELVAAMDQYYLADPRRREIPPISVLLRILPQAAAQAAQPPAAPPADKPSAASPPAEKPAAPPAEKPPAQAAQPTVAAPPTEKPASAPATAPPPVEPAAPAPPR
jgi:hypothetical protein